MDRQPTHASWAGQIRAAYRLNGEPAGRQLDELFGDARAVEGLLTHPGWAVLAGMLRARRAALVVKLGAADVLDQAKYVAMANSIRTFDEALEAGPVLVSIADEVRRAEEEQVKQEARGV